MAGTLRFDRAASLLGADAASGQAMRFLAAGACNTAFGFGVFAVATWIGAPALTALACSTAAGVVFNLQTSRRLVFRTRGGDAGRFVALYLGLLLANWAALSLLRRCGLSQIAAQGLLLAPFAALSFLAQRTFVFTDAMRSGPRRVRAPPLIGTHDRAAQRPVPPPADACVWLFAVGLGGANAAFLLGMLASPWLGAGACGLMVAALVWLLGAPPARWTASADDVRLWSVAAALAVALCLLGGEGRLFYANTDWQIRDAVLADLSNQPWPVRYQESGAAFVLRAPLGMYLLPALAGHAFGWRAAQPTLLIQNTVLMTGVIAVFLSLATRWRDRLIVAAVFVAFSGLDLVGELFLGHFAQSPPWDALFPSLETWAHGLQYPSLITDLFWAPNHAIPAWIMAATYLLWRQDRAPLSAVAAVTGLGALWSPLAVMGTAPFVLVAAVWERGNGRLRPRDVAKLLALGVALLPIAAYLTIDGGHVVHGLNVGEEPFRRAFGLFELLEVAPLLYLASRASAAWSAADRRDFQLCALMLMLAPCYRIGASNDFMMRATIFPITLLAIMTARAISARAPPRCGRDSPPPSLAAERSARGRGLVRLRPPRGLRVPLLVLAIGAATPAAEIVRALAEAAAPPQPTDLFTAWRQPASRGSPKTTYVAASGAYARLAWLLKPAGPTRAAP